MRMAVKRLLVSPEYELTREQKIEILNLVMGDLIKERPDIIDYVKKAIVACGMEPVEREARGGTDGARLTYRGLLCPDVGTGGYAAHGPFEHITVEHMEKQVQVLTEMVKEIAK